MSKARLTVVLSILLILAGLGLVVKNSLPFFVQADVPEVAVKDEESVPPVVQEEKQAEKEVELYSEYPSVGETFGELIIPKISSSLPIVEGTDEDELERGVGHYANSVLPGEKDNSVLSGHRDNVFRRLGEVGVGDLLIVKTTAGEFTYKVRQVRIVDADDRTVIVPKPRATLTVTTCYPFDYIGDAPERYILVGTLIDE
ncbi:class D sortase [Pradoshia sp.]